MICGQRQRLEEAEIEPGKYRPHNLSTAVVDCRPHGKRRGINCKGGVGNTSAHDGLCRVGHEGPMCQLCVVSRMLVLDFLDCHVLNLVTVSEVGKQLVQFSILTLALNLPYGLGRRNRAVRVVRGGVRALRLGPDGRVVGLGRRRSSPIRCGCVRDISEK